MPKDATKRKGPPEEIVNHLIEVHTANGTLDKIANSGIGDKVRPALPSQTGYLGAYTLAYGIEPWSYDGTVLTMLADIVPGPGSSFAGQYGFVKFNGDLYFTAYDPTNGFELRKLDGTTGVVSVFDINPGWDSSYAGQFGFVKFNGDLYFTAYDQFNGWELRKIDGTTGAVSLIADNNPGMDSSYPGRYGGFVTFNGDLYFTAYDEIVGDGHQRIYRKRLALGRCGINIRGRSRKLRVNYRTSEEICKWAVALLQGVDVDDLDDGTDDERGYRSLFHGPIPEIIEAKDQSAEFSELLKWISQLEAENILDKDICIIARDNRTLRLCENHLYGKGIQTVTIKRRQAEDRSIPGLRLATMHRAKGLEFMAVALVAMNDGVVPNVLALRAASDEAGREEVMDAERMLVYVAATRAKKRLFVSSSGKPSEILGVSSLI